MKPSHYTINDGNTLNISVVPTYYHEITETNNVHYQDTKQLNNSFEVNQIGLYKDPILNITVFIVQPSQKLAPRVFPPLPYTNENVQFLREFLFQYSDLNKSEKNRICKFLIEIKHCYATDRNDF